MPRRLLTLRMSLRRKITIAFLIALLPLPAFAVYDYRADVERRVRLVLDGHLQTAQAVAVATDALVGQYRGIGRALGVQSIGSSSEQMEQLLSDELQRDPAFSALSILDVNGRVMAEAPEDGIRPALAADVREVLAGKRLWSAGPVFQGPGGEPRVRLTVAVRTGSEVTGAVCAELNATELGKLIGVRVGERGNYGIIDSTGRALYLSFDPNVRWEDRLRSWIPSINEALKGEPTTIRSFHDPVGDVTRMGASYPVRQLGWVANVFQPFDEALEPIRSELRFTIELLLFALALALGLAAFFSGLLASPIRQLAEAAAAFGRGDYERRVAIETGDEVEQLANRFNAMARVVGSRVAQQELIAQTLQRSFLPSFSEKDFPDLDIGVVYASATEEAVVGGDFYDIFEPFPGVLGVVMGDVAGKGIEAAALSVQVRFMLRALAYHRTDPALVLEELNDILADEIPPGEFVTLFYGVIDAKSNRCTYVNAGHPAPQLHSPDGEILLLQPTGMVVGVVKGISYGSENCHIPDRGYLALYTDGVIEARREATALFGEKRLSRTIEGKIGKSAQEIADSVYEAALSYAGGKLADDLGLLIVHFKRKTTTAGRRVAS